MVLASGRGRGKDMSWSWSRNLWPWLQYMLLTKSMIVFSEALISHPPLSARTSNEKLHRRLDGSQRSTEKYSLSSFTLVGTAHAILYDILSPLNAGDYFHVG